MWHNDLMSILYFNVVVLLFERYRGDVLIYSFFSLGEGTVQNGSFAVV